MKKQFWVVAALTLLVPMTAAADYIGSGTMVTTSSAPYVATVEGGDTLADYDVVSYSWTSGTAINFASWEAFCVERVDRIDTTTYDFYTSDGKNDNDVIATDVLDTWTGNYQEVTWIANWATASTTEFGTYTADEIKAFGQAAIWETLNIFDVNGVYVGSTPTLTDETVAIRALYTTALNEGTGDDYVNDWLLAVSYDQTQAGDGQNFLVKAAPVPEPATMLLFGTGLAGLAAVGRRRRS